MGIFDIFFKKKKEAAKHTVNFDIAGINYLNENGEDKQSILKRVASNYNDGVNLISFNGYTTSEIKEMFADDYMAEFEGQYVNDIIKFILEPLNKHDENAIKVYLIDVNEIGYHIGYVPRKVNKSLMYELEHNTVIRVSAEFTGGKTKSVLYDDFNDKYFIDSEEDTRGVTVKVIFDNELTNISELNLDNEEKQAKVKQNNKPKPTGEKAFSMQVDRNLKGKELEKESRIEEAKKLYLKNVEESFDGSHPYDRLAILYRKEKDYKNEIKILEKAIKVYSNNKTSSNSQLLKFKERLEKAKKLDTKHS